MAAARAGLEQSLIGRRVAALDGWHRDADGNRLTRIRRRLDDDQRQEIRDQLAAELGSTGSRPIELPATSLARLDLVASPRAKRTNPEIAEIPVLSPGGPRPHD